MDRDGDRLNRRLKNGYQRLEKSRHLWARDNNLSDSEYRLLDFFGSTVGWDKKHQNHFKQLEITDFVIGKFLNWSQSKVCRVRNNLTRRKAISKLDHRWYLLEVSFEQAFLGKSLKENIESSPVVDTTLKTNVSIAKLQNIRSSNENTSLGSFKRDLGVSEKESGFESELTDEDKEWINEHLDQEEGSE